MLKKLGDPRMKGVLKVVNGEGWFYSERWGIFQRRKNRVFCYVSPIFGGWKLQLYLTGTTGTCELDVQTSVMSLEAAQLLFDMGNEWLEKYSDGDMKNIHQNRYSISNPDGAWIKGYHNKEWLIV